MENNSPIDIIKPQLERIKTRLQWAKGNKDNVFFKIEYCSVKDKDWHFAQKGSEPAAILKVCKEIINKMGADAIRITLYSNNKPYETEIVKMTDSVIPLIDEDNYKEVAADTKNKESENQVAFYFKNLTETIRQSGLQGPNDFMIQGLQRENENQLKMLQIQHDSAVQRLNDKIEQLKEKCADKDSFIEVLEGEIEALENEIKKMGEELSVKRMSNDKRQDFLLAAGLGKVFNMKNHEIIGLAGLLTGNEAPIPVKAEQGSEELLSPDEQIEEIDGKRKEDIKIITNWLNEIDDSSFQYVCFILKSLAAKPELYIDTMTFLEEKSKAPTNTDLKTDTTSENTEINSNQQ